VDGELTVPNLFVQVASPFVATDLVEHRNCTRSHHEFAELVGQKNVMARSDCALGWPPVRA
jgi:hypothetical protein